ncbi:MAG: gamma-glutamylcyclotransferase [Gammaproteobacteria bacterium]|nr:gamma-glutamylcyclotransferase [Gammaproteobacteria bacterium]MDH3464487.1 gamma-glutamylcyclotransferase [Gammaproteobacteria bacterium]
MRFFFYGTLMDHDVIEIVLGRALDAGCLKPARLEGYCTRIAIDEAVPVLRVAPGASVSGVVIEKLTAADAESIRFFEESEYDSEPCEVVVDGVGIVVAEVHLNSQLRVDENQSWDFERWQAEEKSLFLILARQWMQHVGTTDLRAADEEWDRTRARYLADLNEMG